MTNSKYYTNSRERFEMMERMKAKTTGETYEEPSKDLTVKRPTKLFNWHIRKQERGDGGTDYYAEGNVIDHPFCVNSERVVTKALRGYQMNAECDEVLLYTDETEYHCPISECTFYHESDVLTFMPEMNAYIKRKKSLIPDAPVVDDDTILLVLSDHREFFFEGLYVRHKQKLYSMTDPSVHIGTMKDSCPISLGGLPIKDDTKHDRVEMYYFPHLYYLDFYSWRDHGLSVWIENRGEYTIHCKTPEGLMEINSGKRVRVCSENAIEEDTIPYFLSNGPLYFLSGPAD